MTYRSYARSSGYVGIFKEDEFVFSRDSGGDTLVTSGHEDTLVLSECVVIKSGRAVVVSDLMDQNNGFCVVDGSE